MGVRRNRYCAASGRAAGDWLRCLGFGVLAVTLGFAFIAPSSVLAAFRRSFVHQITRAENPSGLTCSSESPPCLSFGGFAGGVAVDAAGNLWVGDGLSKLDEFDSTGAFIQTLSITRPPGIPPKPEEHPTPPGSLAIARSTGFFYFTAEHSRPIDPPHVEVLDNTGAFVRRWPVGAGAHIAIDNSTEPFDLSAGSIYVTSDTERTISKFDASGKPVSFGGSAGYIEGNEITGTPNEANEHFGQESPIGIAVDSLGNIYAVNNKEGTNAVGEVDEYNPNGVFVRAFTGGETPGLGESHARGGFGGRLDGIAVDPVSEHLLVAVRSEKEPEEGGLDEFDSSGHFLNQIANTEIETSPVVRVRSHLQSAWEMTADLSGSIYVVDKSEHAVDVYGPGRFLPSLKLAEASERHPTSALLNGSVDPEGSSLSECYFEYVSEAAFEKTEFLDLSSGGKAPCTPTAAEIPVNKEYAAVHADLTGLTSGATYRYRLVATTSGPLGGTERSQALAFTAPHPPTVGSTAATNLSSTFADLHAQVNPLGAGTTYQFQYVDEVHYDPAGEDPYAAGTVVPAVPADIGSGGPTGSADTNVVQQIGGLVPGTVYHFRVLAKNEVGATAGSDGMFTTLAQVVPGLPDNRAYELVTPPNKGSAEDMFAHKLRPSGEFENNDDGYPSGSGNGFLLQTYAAFGAFPASFQNVYVFKREQVPPRWKMTALASPLLGIQDVSGPIFDPADLSRVAFGDLVGPQASETGAQGMGLVGSPGGPYSTLHADLPRLNAEEGPEATTIVGASHDVSHVLLQSKNHTLAPGDESQDEGSRALYEWAGGDGCKSETSNCMLVNVDSEGGLLNRCGAVLGQGKEAAHNAVSDDGSKVFFTAPDPYAKPAPAQSHVGCWNKETTPQVNPPQLYMRSGGATIRLSAPETGVSDPTGSHPAVYVGASKDGSKVFFVTETQLTKDAAELGLHDLELYEYDVEASEGKRLVRVSRGDLNSGSAEGNVFTVPAVSDDGSAVYFTAFGRLTSDAPATSGEEVNLYRYDTATGTTTYVARVLTMEAPDGSATNWFTIGTVAPEVFPVPAMSWYTTPDGRYLLFPTTRELKPGYSTVGPCRGMPSTQGHQNGHCEELYRYDAGRPVSEGNPGMPDNPVCVSCNPSGVPPVHHALFATSALSSGNAGAANGPVRAMSDNGSDIFFETADALVPQDINGTLDGYEWHGGRLSLLSSGSDPAPSYFLGSSPDGANVFFGTHARLVPQDADTAGDVYDARICTTVDPCIKPPPGVTAQCEGDACQNPPPAPIDATPTSLTFSGTGNVPSPSGSAVKPRSLTRAQQLAKALRACKPKAKRTRATCEAQARKRYGVKSKAGKKANESVRARHAKKSRRGGR